MQGYGHGPPGYGHGYGQPPPPPAPVGRPICPGCGVGAPTARTSCNVCQTPFGPQPLVASGRVGTAVLACVHAADFACKACGIRSPIATVDCDGEIECMGCGLRQAFDSAQWKEALVFAHGVADLAGPNHDAVSQRSRHAKIGTEYTSSTKTQNTMIMDGGGTRTHSLTTAVSPGHPICKTCHVPLEVWIEGETTKTRCPRCNDAAAYSLPSRAKQTYGAVMGVLANEQRSDRPVAKLGRTAAGVESIVCPQCGAGISAGGGAELVKCAYCNLAVRIPGTLARQQTRGSIPKMDPFWILLDGPSVGRQRLARGKSENPDDDDDEDDDFDSSPGEARPPAGGFGAAPHPPPAFGGQGFGPYAPGPAMGPPMVYAGAPVGPLRSGAAVVIVIALVAVFLLAGIGAGVAFFLADADESPPRPVKTAPKRR